MTRRSSNNVFYQRLCPIHCRLLLLPCLLLLTMPGQALANGFLDGMLSTSWENNVTRGFDESNKENSALLSASATTGKLYQPLRNTSVVLSASAAYHRYLQQSDLSRFDIGTAVSLTQKFGLGPYSPRLGINLTANREWLSGAERDRDLYNLEVSLSKRLNQNWSVSLGIADENSRGLNERPVDFTQLPYTPGVTRPWDPMDYYNDVFFGSVDHEFDNGLLLSGRYQYIDGYIVASAVPPVMLQFLKSKAVALDPAFNQPRLLYLLKTETDAFALNLSIPTGRDTAVDLSVNWEDITAPLVGTYKHALLSINLIHRF